MKDLDPRLGNEWQLLSFNKLPARAPSGAVAIVSYPDDEGVRNNRGRSGAKEGPERILHYLRRLVRHPSCPPIFIIKNSPKAASLLKRHSIAEAWVRKLLEAGYRVVSMGGGHDYGYPDASAYFDVFGGNVLNVDAHLDVRPFNPKKITSGTPFRRWVERYDGRKLIQWGLQIQSNASAHIQWAKANGVKLYSWKDPMPKLRGKLGLSICLDAFMGIRGVSAPAIVGIRPELGLDLIDYYAERTPWLGIYECAPRLDPTTEDSARYAAVLIFRYLYQARWNESRLFSKDR